MDFTSLDEITRTLISVLQQAVDPTETVKVLPEILRNSDLGVGLYLYHAQESAAYKNIPPPGRDAPSVAYTPMALHLFYQLSANWKEGDKEDAIEEQKLMSLAMKALHDQAVIIATIPDGKKINIKITLQHLTPAECVQYWAAAESPVRLSAYYEVSVVFLEPEKPTTYAGRVLQYGNYVFVKGAPQITASLNNIVYTVPGDIVPKEVLISPAQVVPVNALPPTQSNRLVLRGNSFGGGSFELLINRPDWPESAVADATDWELTRIADHTVEATVRETAMLVNAGTPVDVLPGLYTAQIVLSETRNLPNGTVKTFRHSSNLFPFAVTPRIDIINPLNGAAGSSVVITGFQFQHASILPEDIAIFIGEIKLTDRTGQPVINPGEFRITASNTLELRTPNSVLPGLAAVRMLINGVESPPNWITII